jgi:hypothetical protein
VSGEPEKIIEIRLCRINNATIRVKNLRYLFENTAEWLSRYPKEKNEKGTSIRSLGKFIGSVE